MADEKRIATFEWLYQNLLPYKKVTNPPNDKKTVTRKRLTDNYHVDGATLTGYTDDRLVPRGKCIGRLILQGFNGTVRKILMQGTDKILVGGEFTEYNGYPAKGLIRLNLDGSIDYSFDIGLGFYYGTGKGKVEDMLFQPDGKLLIIGSFDYFNGNIARGRVRLNSNMTIDTSFITTNVDGLDGGILTCIILDQSNNVYIGGEFSRFIGQVSRNLVKLDQNGNVSKTFDLGASGRVMSVVVTATSIYAAGSISTLNGSGISKIVKMKLDGTKDTTFSPPTINGFINSIIVENNNSVVMTGTFTTPANRFMKLQSNGNLDTSFTTGSGLEGTGFSITKTSNGRYLVVGSFQRYRGSYTPTIVMINNTGTHDTTFNIGTGLNGTGLCSYEQPDGKILIGGSFTDFNSNSSPDNIVRLNTNGTYDRWFNNLENN